MDASLGTVQMRAEFANPRLQLLPGQYVKVRVIAGSREAIVVPQTEFTPDRLAAILRDALAAPAKLKAAAAAAKSVGVPDAAERLAELVLDIARPA